MAVSGGEFAHRSDPPGRRPRRAGYVRSMSEARGFIVALSAFLAVLVSVSSAVAHREEGVSAAASVS